MTTHAQIKHRQHDMLRRVMIVILIVIAAALILFSSAFPSRADSPQASTPTTPKATATPGGPELVEIEASFTIGDIGQFSHPPSVSVQRVEPDGTVIILNEGFEGSWPPPGWVAQPNWGASSCRAFAGSKSAWVEGSAGLACGSDYFNDENAFLIYGPFSLADATAASLSFQLWLNSERDYDFLCRMVSADGTSFGGICTHGKSNDWIERVLDLTNVPTVGNVTGQPAVWIALVWNTDTLIAKAEGAFVDNVRVTKTIGGPTVTPTPTSTPTRTPTLTPTPLPTPAWWWQVETVYFPANPEESTSITLDSAGRPYISFQDFVHLMLANWDGSDWRVETVDGAIFVGKHSSLALNGADRPHIAYYDGYNLKYARWDGFAWQIETVDSAGNVGNYTSLVLDAADYSHISYYVSSPDSDLKYARWDGSTWQIETVDSAGSVGRYTSLALDVVGYQHISYYDDTNDDLKYARWDGSTWRIETVDSAGDVGQYTSLVLDMADRPHISYYDRSNRDLKYAWWDGSAWQIETVDSDGDVGLYTSMALDGAGRPHISYYRHIDYRNGELKYARRDDGTWHTELVESGNVGKGSSLALNAAGRPLISYVDDTAYDLKFALWLDAPLPTPTPTSTPVTPTPVVPPGQAQSYWPELAPAAGGGAIVVWYDDRFGSPYYDDVFARRFGPDGNPVWPGDARVSAGPGTGSESYPAIAVDESGHSLVIWDRGELFAQKLDPSGQHVWSSDIRVYDSWNGFQPRVGLDPHGNWYAGWGTNFSGCELWPRGTVGPCSIIYAAKLGTRSWSDRVSDFIYAHAYWPDMAVDPDGNIHLAWQQGSSQGDSDIFGMALFSDKERRWPNPVRINSDTGSAPQARPRMAVNAAGDTYFVWADKRNGSWDVYAQKFDVNVGHRLWADDIRVDSDATNTDQTEPDVAVDADGYIYIVWADGRNGIADIYAQKLTPEGTRVWSQDLRINATSRADGRSGPVITVGAAGALYIAWESRRDNQHDIFMQSYTTDGACRWVADVPVEGVLTRELYLPLIRRGTP